MPTDSFQEKLRYSGSGANPRSWLRRLSDSESHGSRGRPTGIALAALSLALAQPTAPDLWFSPGPQDSGKERVI